jgi:NAD(P)H-hydrate epimerase
MKVLLAAQMRDVDRLTTERYGIPSIQLMENAASRTIEAAENRFGSLERREVLVLSGKGNNGGDGAAIARQLAAKGASIRLVLLGKLEETAGDARINFERAKELARSDSTLNLAEVTDAAQLKAQLNAASPALIVDALLGTGLGRPAAGLFGAAIELMNQRSETTPVVAVDIPSGLSSDSAELNGPAVRADLTVTFTAPKPGNVLPPASDNGGDLMVVQIGSPDELVRSIGAMLNLTDPHMIAGWLTGSRRARHANKGDAGKVLVVAGARGKTGAACLCGEAAMRSGAGLVTIASPLSAQPLVASRAIPECMTEPLDETDCGGPAPAAAARVAALEAGRDVLVLGPGLGAYGENLPAEFVSQVISRRTTPTILDADGLNSLAPWPAEIRGELARPLILTPHPGEMSRLTGFPIAEIVRNRLDVARSFATVHGVILVLKLSRTIIAAPDGQVYINPTGNEGMATGGSGDVLTGLIGGLLAQATSDPLGSTIAAVYLHGLAGDIAASQCGIRAMVASDITARFGDAFIEAGGTAERLERRSAR